MTVVERAQAAEFLGVSISTLDRMASQGRLTRGRARRKTRPVTVYDEAELRVLKESLASSPKEVFRRQNTPTPQAAIGFRLDPYYVKRLTEEGANSGMSAGDYARRLVIRGLEETVTERYTEETRALRKSLSGMFYLILVEKFDASPEEANQLVAALGA